MKVWNKFLLLIILAFGVTSVLAQKVTKQEIDKPAEGKALIYIANLATRKFDVFNRNEKVSNIKSAYYIKYTVEPGNHLFWIASNPSNFVEAQVAANLVYVITLESDSSASTAAVFGALGSLANSAMAGAYLKVLDPSNSKDKKTFYRIIKNMRPAEFDLTKNIKAEAETEKMVKKALDKYDKFVSEGKEKKILGLSPNMNFENADKPNKEEN